MNVLDWLSNNYIEIFGAVTGVLFVILEVRQSIWLWPVGILTSAFYIFIFFTAKLYADMTLQGYYLIISIIGWYWWIHGSRFRRSISKGERPGVHGSGNPEDVGQVKGNIEEGMKNVLQVTRLKRKTGLILTVVFVFLYCLMWQILSRFTDSPVPGWDSFITSLSIVATWMLARKIYEHWFVWILVNIVSAVLFFNRGLHPTVILYAIYAIMSFTGLFVWKKAITQMN